MVRSRLPALRIVDGSRRKRREREPLPRRPIVEQALPGRSD